MTTSNRRYAGTFGPNQGLCGARRRNPPSLADTKHSYCHPVPHLFAAHLAAQCMTDTRCSPLVVAPADGMRETARCQQPGAPATSTLHHGLSLPAGGYHASSNQPGHYQHQLRHTPSAPGWAVLSGEPPNSEDNLTHDSGTALSEPSILATMHTVYPHRESMDANDPLRFSTEMALRPYGSNTARAQRVSPWGSASTTSTPGAWAAPTSAAATSATASLSATSNIVPSSGAGVAEMGGGAGMGGSGGRLPSTPLDRTR